MLLRYNSSFCLTLDSPQSASLISSTTSVQTPTSLHLSQWIQSSVSPICPSSFVFHTGPAIGRGVERVGLRAPQGPQPIPPISLSLFFTRHLEFLRHFLLSFPQKCLRHFLRSPCASAGPPVPMVLQPPHVVLVLCESAARCVGAITVITFTSRRVASCCLLSRRDAQGWAPSALQPRDLSPTIEKLKE